MTILSKQGIRLGKMRINAECNINFAKTFDISESLSLKELILKLMLIALIIQLP